MTESNALQRFVEEQAPLATAQEPKAALIALLLFELEGSLYAAPLEHIREVARADAVTRIPQAPLHVRGVQSLRGVVVPVLEVRTRLGLEPAQLSAASRIVVAELGRRWVGLLVDRVQQVAHVPRANLKPPPGEVRTPLSTYLVGTVHVGAQIALVLDLNQLLVLPGAEAPSR